MKLLSDEELHDHITELRRQRDLHLMDESDYTQKVIDIIQSQKKAHADYVIGEDEPLDMNLPGNVDLNLRKYNNQFREEQRNRNGQQ